MLRVSAVTVSKQGKNGQARMVKQEWSNLASSPLTVVGEATSDLHSCHQRFRSREEMEDFTAERKETAGYIERTNQNEVDENVLNDMMSRLHFSG